MTARLKEHLPQLVTIAVSQHRDVLDMVWLINHGQIFRFLRKPLSAGRCAISLQAALQHHRLLLKNPELVKRHEVDATAPDNDGRHRRRHAREAQEHEAPVGVAHERPQKRNRTNQSDLLLWVAGGAIAAVGVAWLVIMKPWADSDAGHQATRRARREPRDGRQHSRPRPDAPAADAPAAERDGGTLDNPLRMAQLAYDAGMLVEPEEYSAWTLYSRVVKSEPNNADAVEGLTKVADDLVRRGETALEQGRFDDARAHRRAHPRGVAGASGREGARARRSGPCAAPSRTAAPRVNREIRPGAAAAGRARRARYRLRRPSRPSTRSSEASDAFNDGDGAKAGC